MTKKKPSPQNRIWEKERRDRLNQTFDSLSKLLPDYEPATQLSKIEILQRAIEYVEKLQGKIKDFLEERDALLKKHVDELEERLQVLIARNEDLAALLKKANINVPPCKHGSSPQSTSNDEEKDSAEVVEKQQEDTNKTETATSNKKLASPKKKVIEKDSSSPKVEETPEQSASIRTSVIQCSTATVTTTTAAAIPVIITSAPITAPSVPSTCLVMANNQIVGTLNQTNVNVTPALLPTPIMATGVLISNGNGSLLQMPLVPPSSSLLIVSNEDVRSKISMKKTRRSSVKGKVGTGTTPSSRTGKFTIKSIDVIPGRIVNGKIPIPALKRPPRPQVGAVRVKKENLRKRRKRKVSERREGELGGDSDVKKAKLDEKGVTETVKVNLKEDKRIDEKNQIVNHATEDINQAIEKDPAQVDDRASSLDMNLDQGDLSADIFANLQVPDEEADANQGSLSPTAAYLMNFPLVATGGKTAGNLGDGPGEIETPDCVEEDKKGPTQTGDNNLLLDSFSSYFGSNIYGGIESTVPPVPEAPVSTVVTSSSFSTIYQSIDSMLEHKPVKVTTTSDCRYNTTPFTFTLTSTSNTTSTQSYDYRHSSSSNYFYPAPTVTTTKPIDDFCLPKPPIVTEFTFSLTSTTPSTPKTVQSPYTNSTIFSSTITTPSYSTYGYQSKPSSSKTSNYNASYIAESCKFESKAPRKYDFLEAEKPATSFTFSLTTTTKTIPKYTHPNVATSTVPYMASYPVVTTTASFYPKVEDCLYKSSKSTTNHGHNPYKTPSKQKPNPCPVAPGSSQTQSKYDVSWMASQDPKPTTNTPQDYTQLLPAIDFTATPSHSYQTNFDLSRKSDIFFAHPSGPEDNLVTWSPNKLTNILNDTSSSYYPSTNTSLPSLHGDLALNCPPKSATTNHQRKATDSGSSTFLSVQQLVDQPRKISSKNYSSCSSNFTSNNQKPLNNNYSAEALISGSTTTTRKDKYYNDSGYSNYNSYGDTPTAATTGMSFNFDYTSTTTDHNKNTYNYSCHQQNYIPPPFIDNSYGGLTNIPPPPPPTFTTSSSTATVTSYTASTNNYYQNPPYHQSSSSIPTSDLTPYYVPSSEKRSSTKPPKKHHHKAPSNDYSSLPSTYPAILPPPPPSTLPQLDDPLLTYNNTPVPNYSFNSPSVAAQQSYPVVANTSTSLTNFNLSTICPEISEKNSAAGSSQSNNIATSGGGSSLSMSNLIGGPIVRHALVGGSGW